MHLHSLTLKFSSALAPAVMDLLLPPPPPASSWLSQHPAVHPWITWLRSPCLSMPTAPLGSQVLVLSLGCFLVSLAPSSFLSQVHLPSLCGPRVAPKFSACGIGQGTIAALDSSPPLCSGTDSALSSCSPVLLFPCRLALLQNAPPVCFSHPLLCLLCSLKCPSAHTFPLHFILRAFRKPFSSPGASLN